MLLDRARCNNVMIIFVAAVGPCTSSCHHIMLGFVGVAPCHSECFPGWLCQLPRGQGPKYPRTPGQIPAAALVPRFNKCGLTSYWPGLKCPGNSNIVITGGCSCCSHGEDPARTLRSLSLGMKQTGAYVAIICLDPAPWNGIPCRYLLECCPVTVPDQKLQVLQPYLSDSPTESPPGEEWSVRFSPLMLHTTRQGPGSRHATKSRESSQNGTLRAKPSRTR